MHLVEDIKIRFRGKKNHHECLFVVGAARCTHLGRRKVSCVYGKLDITIKAIRLNSFVHVDQMIHYRISYYGIP